MDTKDNIKSGKTLFVFGSKSNRNGLKSGGTIHPTTTTSGTTITTSFGCFADK